MGDTWTTSRGCRWHRTVAVQLRTSCRWLPPYAECLLAAMALNLKRMVNAIFFYLQFQCTAGKPVDFGRIFAFVNRSFILPYPAGVCPAKAPPEQAFFNRPHTKKACRRMETFCGRPFSLAYCFLTCQAILYRWIPFFFIHSGNSSGFFPQ